MARKGKIRRTEGGHKRGHSNVSHCEYTEVIKAEQKRRRRQQDKAVVEEQIEPVGEEQEPITWFTIDDFTRFFDDVKEDDEPKKDRVSCPCGNDTFRVYITTVIDDARMYCARCGKALDG